MKKYSSTAKSAREREVRRQMSEARRFNQPLKIFIERKYGEIFREYTELYNRIDAENPNRKNLVTSKAFKEWMNANPLREPPATGQSTLQLLMPQILLEPVGSPHSKVQQEVQQSTDDLKDQEIHQAETPELNNDIIADIVNELAEEPVWQNMFQQPNVFEDEGIELNPDIDIEMDIEPFDFNIEVEHYDF